MKQEQYIEPIGFKGTPNKWQSSFNDKAIMNGDEPQDNTMVCMITGHPDYEEIRANRKLISQSKELAKALQDMIKRLEFHIGVTNSFLGDTIAIENAKQVLKEAGLTDKYKQP